MKYRIHNPDDTPTELVYDTLHKANYMLNVLAYYAEYHGMIKEEPEPAKLPGYGAPEWEHLPP